MKRRSWNSVLTFGLVLFSGGAVLKSGAALPDLIIYAPSVDPQVVYRTFSSNDCTIGEGCVQAGTRQLLIFTTENRNVGDADLVLGDPSTNSAFHFDPCHNHYHYAGFAEYRLRDASSNIVVVGRKMGFCVEDDFAWDPNASPNRRYDCDYQGIQKGWADVYTGDLPCQWIDITGVPSGNYILEMETNPDRTIVESDYSNNITRVPVVVPPPCTSLVANDNFSNATVITRSPFSYSTRNACASKEPGEPYHAGDVGGHSVWYKGFAPSNSIVRLTTAGSDFDTLLAVYTGSSVDNLTLVASNDDIAFPTIEQSSLSFPAVSGNTYYIAVDGYDGAVGNIVLSINPPFNDAFTNCQSLSGAIGQTNGYTIGASKEPGEPDHNADFGGHSVWYCWTAPANGAISFDTIGSDFDTLLAVYTGSAVNALTVVASDNDSGGNGTSRVVFNAMAGKLYHVAVDGVHGATGNLVLHWKPPGQLSLQKVSGTTVALTLTGAPGTYSIQSSSDLAHWTNLTSMTVSGSSQQYNDNSVSTSARRFYRAVSP